LEIEISIRNRPTGKLFDCLHLWLAQIIALPPLRFFFPTHDGFDLLITSLWQLDNESLKVCLDVKSFY